MIWLIVASIVMVQDTPASPAEREAFSACKKELGIEDRTKPEEFVSTFGSPEFRRCLSRDQDFPLHPSAVEKLHRGGE